ncbi:MAG: alpha/beta hydrolase-fold protein [Cyclobacteriaceae bacterium]
MKIKLLFVFVLVAFDIRSQDYSSFKSALAEIHRITSISDSAQRQSEIQKVWSSLRDQNKIPLIVEDSVAFLYQGEAKSVSWLGDFNGWGYDKNFKNQGMRLGNSNVWLLKSAFPKDARLDYKIVLNGSDYILDPENNHQQWSGVGGGSPNSELRMPLWKESPEQVTHNDTPHGIVKRDILLNSKILGYQITYSVYLPNGYEKLGKMPCIYVTDGYEYLHPQLGNMTTVLDNLIAEKKIKPVVGIFVDHREPINRSNNKRMQELAMNSTYLDFFVKELIPEVEKNYPVISESTQRAILGTSMGGLTSTYFAFQRPDIFGLAGIQSPAFWTKPQIYQLCTGISQPKMKISMTSGLINDTSKESRKMKEILATSSCEYHYREVNEGHSWGNWKNLLGDVMIDLFGNK